MSFQELIRTQLETPPVTESDLKQVQSAIKTIFPNEYLDFLKVADGGLWNNERVIMYSCGNAMPQDDRLLAANLNRPDAKLLFIGRFSEDEFGYLLEGISPDTKIIYVFDHETDEIHQIASDMTDFFTQFSLPPEEKKKGLFSFLFS